MVTIAIYGWEDENMRDVCAEHVRAQTLQDVEILMQGEDEDSILFRNRAVAEAKGEYITFLHAKARYVFPNALQLMMLTAQTEDAEMVAGKCGVTNGVNTIYPDELPWNVENAVSSNTYQNQFKGDLGALSGCLWNTSFLRKNRLDFEDGGPFAEERLLRKSAALVGTVFELGRSFTWCNSACSCDFTKTEASRARIGFYLDLLRFADEKGCTAFRDFILAEIFESPHTAELRDYYWSLRESDEKSAVKAELESLAALTDRAKVEDAFLNPLVSVVVPVYNAEKYLDGCLGSITRQTLRSLEIICVNDGSSDGSLDILNRWAEGDGRIVVLTQENAGQSSARNRALDCARGKYIAFVDSDDAIEPQMLEKMVEPLERDDDIDFSKCGTKAVYEYEVTDAEKKGLAEYFAAPAEPGAHDISPKVFSTGAPWNKLYRRAFLDLHGIRFPEGVKNEDEAFCFFVFARARRLYLFHEQFYLYTRNLSGTMARQAHDVDKGKVPDCFSVYNLILEFLDSEDAIPLYGEFLKRLLGAYSRFEDTAVGDQCLAMTQDMLRRARFHERADFCARKREYVVNYGNRVLCKVPDAVPEYADLKRYLPRRIPNRRFAPVEAPKISFIVPAYNQEQYLSRCIESLRWQTLDEIEIICVNDGSTDRTGVILKEYAVRDGRISILEKQNSGVSDSRNRGLAMARGEYVAFVDGDDWVAPDYAEKVHSAAQRFNADLVSSDFRCIDYLSGRQLDHWWTWDNQVRRFGLRLDEPQSFADMPYLRIYGSSWQWLFRRRFLADNRLTFPGGMRLSEDLLFMAEVFTVADKFVIVPNALYFYRRGNPSSAISRLSFTSKATAAGPEDARVETIRRLSAFIVNGRGAECPVERRAKLFLRLFGDMLLFAEKGRESAIALGEEMSKMPSAVISVAQAIDKGKWERFLKVLQQAEKARTFSSPAEWAASWMPKNAVEKIEKIRKLRQLQPNKDKIIVISFLSQESCSDCECIDSWTFFRYLQDHNVPSCYVTSAGNTFYAREIKGKGHAKDVIALSGGGLADCELIDKCRDVLVRARAIVMEDIALPFGVIFHFREWNDLALVLLQHGVIFTFNKSLQQHLPRFNYINVTGEREADCIRKMIQPIEYSETVPSFIYAGLPRFDLLSNASQLQKGRGPHTVLFMPTWRHSFKTELALVRSMYFNRIIAFLRSQKVARLREQGVRIVYAPHHAIGELLNGKLDVPVEVCQGSEVSRWIREADCLLTDFSSVTFDFLFQDKPVIFWAIDNEDRTLSLDDQEKVLQGRHAVEEIGKCAKTVDAVIDLVEDCMRRDFLADEGQKRYAAGIFKYRSGICRHLYDEIQSQIEIGQVTGLFAQGKSPSTLPVPAEGAPMRTTVNGQSHRDLLVPLFGSRLMSCSYPH